MKAAFYLITLALCGFVTSFGAHVPPLIGVVVAAGIGSGIVWTNSDTLVSTLAGKGQLGASIGAAQAFKEFGDMVGPLLVGLLTQFFGVRIGFVSCGVHCVGIFLLADARTSRIDAELAALVRQSVKSA